MEVRSCGICRCHLTQRHACNEVSASVLNHLQMRPASHETQSVRLHWLHNVQVRQH